MSRRTKGNTKPSSSSNAFNLFLKYSGTNEQPPISELSNYSSLTDESSHEIFVAIKKCYKKDMITKSKGLKDILELFKNSDDYNFLLKHWIKVFLNLSNDDDFQVREITLTTFEQINKLVKSQLTPFLKQIVPHWLCLAGDPHGNVSKIATQTFSTTFGKNKLNEVFVFCKEQICSNVDTILFKTNYNEKKNEIRLLPGAFYSIMVLSKVAKDDEFINNELIKLLDNEQFWKYSKFNDNNVQLSWFNLINSLLQSKFSLIENYLKKVNQMTFNRLGDKNVSLQESIWSVLFTLMKLDQENCFNELKYDKVQKSFNDLFKNSSFNQHLLINNLDLILRYFLFKNENKVEFMKSLFNLFMKEILAQNDPTLVINLYFQSLLFIIRNSELISSDQDNVRALLNQQINDGLSSVIDIVQLSSDSKRLQEIFKKLVNFSLNLKLLDCDQQVHLIKKLILESVKNKLEEGEFDLLSIKNLLNIIFNLKAYQSKNKLNLFLVDSTNEKLEFIQYKFGFYEETDDLEIKKELLKEVLNIVIKQKEISNNFIEFLNYLVQLCCYLNVLDDQLIDNFISYFRTLNQQINNLDDNLDKKKLIIKLYYVINQIILKSSQKIDYSNQLNNSSNVFAFIFTLQLFKDETKINLITDDILSVYNVLFEEFKNCLTTKKISCKELLNELDEHLHDEDKNKVEDKFAKKLIEQLTDESELNLLNALYSLLSLKLDHKIYENIFNELLKLDQNDEKHILNYLILDYLNKTNKVLPVKTIENLIFGFIEFTYQKCSIETPTNLWSDVLLKSLKANSAKPEESRDVINNLSIKFKQMLLDQKPNTTFEQLNLIISNIYIFVVNLSTLNEYSNASSLDKVVRSILIDEDEFKQLKNDLNKKVFEFLWIKNDFTDYDFYLNQNITSDDLNIPSLIKASYTSLKVSKLLQFINTNDIFDNETNSLERLIDESTDEKINILIQNDSNLEYLFDYSTLSYCYLKVLNQIYSYGMILENPNDLIECHIHFYEKIYKKLNDKFIKSYANKRYQSNHEDTFVVLSLHHLLNAVSADNVFEFETINKSLKINNFSMIMKFINRKNLELFLDEIIQYNLVSKTNYPDNFEDIKEYLNIIAICLKSYLITIDYEKNLYPIVNSLMSYQEKIQAKEIEDRLYLKDRFDDSTLTNEIVSVINFLDQFIRRGIDDLSSKFTNFLFYSILKWTELLNQEIDLLISKNHLCNYLNRLFALINNVSFIMQLNMSNLRNARTNWLENYSFKINERLFRFFIKLSKLEINFVHYDMINTLGKCLVEIDNNNLIKIQLKEDDSSNSKTISDEDDLKLPANFNRLFNQFANLLMKKNSIFTLTSHHLIKIYLELLADQLNHDLEFSNYLEDRLFLKPPNFLLDLIDRINEELSENSNFNEHTNSLRIIYFLVWKNLIEFWDKLNEQIKYTMANYLKDNGLIDALFVNFNSILPIDKHLLAVYYKHGLSKTKMMEYFLNVIHLESSNLWSVNTLYHLGCQIYLQIFKSMPTTMRLWINTAPNQSQIKDFTSKFISDIIIKDELKMIQDKAANSLENLKFIIRKSTNEVITSYSFEDVKIELTLTLPKNYPIELIKINSGSPVGLDRAKWRSFELQLTNILAQNGSVYDGILVWINNIKKTFQNHEECMICFYVLQSSNYQLPKKICKHCRKRFHSLCINQWFKKSNKRTCPLCRNEM